MAAGSERGRGARRWRRALPVALGLVLVAGVLGWVGVIRGDDGPRDELLPPAPAPRAAVTPARGGGVSPERPAAVSVSPGGPLAPIVDAVELEKDEVCEGEENLVTVRAHTEGGLEDAWLHAVIGGSPGMSVPLRAARGERGTSAPRLVTVFGRDNVATTVAVPSFRVKDCTETRWLLIERRLRPNSDADLELRATLVDLEGGARPAPEHWIWDFGDGQSLETTRSYARHDYGRRRQDTLYSQFLVRVDGVATDGSRVVGRTTVALRNTAFTNLAYAGVLTLVVELEPRFPVTDDHGVVRQQVRLWHHDERPVAITRARSRRNFDDERRPTVAEISIAGLLGTSVVPPAGLVTHVSLDTTREPGLFSIDYELEGASATGVPVRGAFSIMVPPPPPTPESSIPVEDPRQRARIRRAMSLLHKAYVTEADLQTLELQGAFSDLAASAPPPAPVTPRYGDVPPHPPRRDEPHREDKLLRDDEAPPLPADLAPP